MNTGRAWLRQEHQRRGDAAGPRRSGAARHGGRGGRRAACRLCGTQWGVSEGPAGCLGKRHGIDAKGVVLACGLGLEAPVSVLQITRNTTPMYRTPEIVDLYSNFPIGEKQDIWVRRRGRGAGQPCPRALWLPFFLLLPCSQEPQ